MILGYGAGVISRDLVGKIKENENIIYLAYVYKSGLLGLIKSGRIFHNYLVFTTRRIIYIEKAQKVFSLSYNDAVQLKNLIVQPKSSM